MICGGTLGLSFNQPAKYERHQWGDGIRPLEHHSDVRPRAVRGDVVAAHISIASDKHKRKKQHPMPAPPQSQPREEPVKQRQADQAAKPFKRGQGSLHAQAVL
jgi:hypothetical protein